MTLTVTGRHLTVSEAVRTDITKKLGRLERLLGESAVSAQVVLSLDGKASVCELTLHVRGDHTLHGVGQHQRMPSAITVAVEKVSKQASRLKDRWKTRRRAAEKLGIAAAAAATTAAAGPPARPRGKASAGGPRGDSKRRVIRSRARPLKPMTIDDAVLALTGEARSFLVFRVAPSETLAILYTRPDGHYGLIEPEG